jgi:predicted dehydrogenase
MTLAPGHFHAALVLKEMLPEVYARTYVYAPLNADTLDYVERVAAFNARRFTPTDWEIDLRAGPNYLARFLREQPGNAVVIAGRNRVKIDHMLAAAENACHILADKPWVIRPEDFPKIAEVYEQADLRETLVWDMMTERHEVTTIFQRHLMQDRDVMGDLLPGSPEEPTLELASTHYLNKVVTGVPLWRPVWYFDPTESGIAIADVGTHLADLSIWMLFPDEALEYAADVRMLGANTWPTPLTLDQFATVTGKHEWPDRVPLPIEVGILQYAGNGTVSYTLRGLHVKYTCLWEYEAPPGGNDRHFSIARGSLANTTVRTERGPNGQTRPELYVVPHPQHRAAVNVALALRIKELHNRYPGVKAEERGNEIRIVIPDRFRTQHEEHFAEVLDEFLRHARNPRRALSTEMKNCLAKYYITTQSVKLAGGAQG